jgi:hypothetical protein
VHVLSNGALVAHGGLSSRWLQKFGGGDGQAGGAAAAWTAAEAARLNLAWQQLLARADGEEGIDSFEKGMVDDRSPIWFRPFGKKQLASDVRLGQGVPFCVVAHTPQEDGFGYSFGSEDGRYHAVSGLRENTWHGPPPGSHGCTVGVDFTLSRAFGPERLERYQAILGVERHLPVFKFLPLPD